MAIKNKKVLITGGAGFIGANLVRKLITDGGFEVFVIEKSGVNLWRLQNVLNKVTITYTDIENLTELQKNIDDIKPNFVFHLATYGVYSALQTDVRKMIDVNIKGTLNLVDALKNCNVQCFVHTASCGEYKAKKSSLNEDDPVDPSNAYHITKLATELLLKKMVAQTKMSIINLRLFTAYGLYEDRQRLIPHIILNALDNKKVELSSPNYVRDFIFIEDLTDAFLKIIQSKKRYQADTFNIGSGKQYNIESVVKTVEKLLGKKISAKYGKRKSYYDEPEFFQANNKKAKIAFNWKPTHSLESGIAKTINWFKENKEYYL